MSTPISLKAKSKKKATGDEVEIFEDFRDAGKAGAFSESSDSGSGSDSDSDSVPDSSSGSAHEFGSDTTPRANFNDPQLSRDELLAYLENMRGRFSAKQTTDSFADQDEVLIITSKEKSGPTYTLQVQGLMLLAGICQN